MVRDPVCGMEIDPDFAEGTSEFDGETFYFCTETCKRKFDSDPEKYVTATEQN